MPVTVRLLTGGRIVLGTILLLAPDSVLGRLSPRPVRPADRAVARLLGARHLVEGAFVARHPSPGRLLAGAAVDATHSLSMVALAVLKPDHRRLAAASALTAAATATVGILTARSTHRHARRRSSPGSSGPPGERSVSASVPATFA